MPRQSVSDLVTRALAIEAEDPDLLQPREIIQNNVMIEPGELADIVARVRLRLDKATLWDKISEIVAYQITSSLFRDPSKNVLMLLHAEEAANGSRESQSWLKANLHKLESDLRNSESKRRRATTIGDFAGSIYYIENLLGEDTTNRLAEITGVKKSTVKRWLTGSSAQWNNTYKIMNFALVIWTLQEEKGFSRREVLNWLASPLNGGPTPYQLWTASSWNTPVAIIKALGEIVAR